MIIITRAKPQSQSNVIYCVLITLLVCLLIHRFLKNRTIEIEKFSNTPVVYSSQGHDLNVKKR